MQDSIIPGVKGAHYEYLVTTVLDAPRRRVEVRRRFNDFVVSCWRPCCYCTLFFSSWVRVQVCRRANGFVVSC